MVKLGNSLIQKCDVQLWGLSVQFFRWKWAITGLKNATFWLPGYKKIKNDIQIMFFQERQNKKASD